MSDHWWQLNKSCPLTVTPESPNCSKIAVLNLIQSQGSLVIKVKQFLKEDAEQKPFVVRGFKRSCTQKALCLNCLWDSWWDRQHGLAIMTVLEEISLLVIWWSKQRVASFKPFLLFLSDDHCHFQVWIWSPVLSDRCSVQFANAVPWTSWWEREQVDMTTFSATNLLWQAQDRQFFFTPLWTRVLTSRILVHQHHLHHFHCHSWTATHSKRYELSVHWCCWSRSWGRSRLLDCQRNFWCFTWGWTEANVSSAWMHSGTTTHTMTQVTNPEKAKKRLWTVSVPLNSTAQNLCHVYLQELVCSVFGLNKWLKLFSNSNGRF